MAVGAGCDMVGNSGEVMGSVGGGAGCAFVNLTQVLGEGTSHLTAGNGSYDEMGMGMVEGRVWQGVGEVGVCEWGLQCGCRVY